MEGTMSARYLTILSCLFIALGADAGFAQTPAPASQDAPDYRRGFTDGCLHATEGMMRNETRFNTDMLYHAGWQKGFQNCYPHQTINTNGDPNGPLKNLF
jgi:hypothetical protein